MCACLLGLLRLHMLAHQIPACTRVHAYMRAHLHVHMLACRWQCPAASHVCSTAAGANCCFPKLLSAGCMFAGHMFSHSGKNARSMMTNTDLRVSTIYRSAKKTWCQHYLVPALDARR